jgi:predicted DNA-binding protein
MTARCRRDDDAPFCYTVLVTQLTLSISPEAAARLDAEAQARGVTRETVAAETLEAVMWESESLDWAEDERRLE